MTDDHAKLKALNTLLKSRGWAVIREVMEREILTAARSLGGTASMATDEMHFRRGAIYAADRLLAMPETLTRNLEASVLFDEAIAQHDPEKGHS